MWDYAHSMQSVPSACTIDEKLLDALVVSRYTPAKIYVNPPILSGGGARPRGCARAGREVKNDS